MFPDQLPQLDAFEILTRLGGGGMAEVFLGRARGDTGFEKLVAIKQLRPHMANNSSFINMLLDEARLAANLSHINIGQTYDLKRIDDNYYIIMEFIQGVSLHQINGFFLDATEPPPQPMVAYIAASLCAGLSYAHDKSDPQGIPLKIIHRDVSPDNVMVSYEGEVKLIDFGVAKGAPRQQETIGAQIKGKPIYMSPEQARSAPLDHRADIYAAGLVLYEMLTQRTPMQEAELHLQIQMAARPRIAPPSTVVSTVDPALERICMKALAVDPEQRYASAGLMEQELGAYLQQQPYYRQELATWMKATFGEELEALQQIISNAGGRRSPGAALDLLSTPGTDLVASPAGYEDALRVVQVGAAPDTRVEIQAEAEIEDDTAVTAVTEAAEYDQTNVLAPLRRTTPPPDASPVASPTIQLPTTAEEERPPVSIHQAETVQRKALSIHQAETVPRKLTAKTQSTRSRRPWQTILALALVGAVTLGLALALFLGIQRPAPLGSAQQQPHNQDQGRSAIVAPDLGAADSAPLAQRRLDLQSTPPADHEATVASSDLGVPGEPGRKLRRIKRHRPPRTKRSTAKRSTAKKNTAKKNAASKKNAATRKKPKGLPFDDL